MEIACCVSSYDTSSAVLSHVRQYVTNNKTWQISCNLIWEPALECLRVRTLNLGLICPYHISVVSFCISIGSGVRLSTLVSNSGLFSSGIHPFVLFSWSSTFGSVNKNVIFETNRLPKNKRK